MKIKVRKYRPKKTTGLNIEAIEALREESKGEGTYPPPKYELEIHRGSIIDVKIMFGKKWNGFNVSEMLEDYDGRRYVHGFLLGLDNNFPEEFREAVQEVVENRGYNE